MTAIYSADRERRLRLVVRVVFVLGVLLAALAAYAVGVVGGDNRPFGVAVGAVAALLLAASGLALKVLPERDRTARLASVATGMVTLLAGLFLAKTFLGVVVIVLAIAVLVLALLRDDPDLEDAAR